MTGPGDGTMDVHGATAALARRYLDLTEGLDPGTPFSDPRTALANVRWMCAEIVAKGRSLPVDKVSRWLGFVQGVLACKGLIDCDAERDVSRPLFHAAYAASGQAAPPTLENPLP